MHSGQVALGKNAITAAGAKASDLNQ